MRFPRRKSPAPVVRTHIEYDLSELNATPAMIEPTAYCQALALDSAGLYVAYLRTGVFDKDQAFELLGQQLDAVLYRGPR